MKKTSPKEPRPLLERLRERINRYEKFFPDNNLKILSKLCLFCFGEICESIFSRRHLQRSGRIKIGIILFGGLGDYILNIPFLASFGKFVENSSDIVLYSRSVSIDSFIGIFKYIEGDFPKNISMCADRREPSRGDCDLLLELLRCPTILFADKKRLKALSGQNGGVYKYVLEMEHAARVYPCMKNRGSLYDVHFTQMMLCLGKKRWEQSTFFPETTISRFFNDNPNVRLNTEFSENELKSKYFKKNDIRYITIQRGVQSGGESTKCWPVAHYNEFVTLFKKDYPEIQVVQLGSATSEKILGTDLDLSGKTSFEELKGLLKYSVLHIDGECGMVHLRRLLNGGKSVVLFGPTNEQFFGYPENCNISARPCGCACEYVFNDWNSRCAFSGKSEAICMQSINPEFVFLKCREILENS